MGQYQWWTKHDGDLGSYFMIQSVEESLYDAIKARVASGEVVTLRLDINDELKDKNPWHRIWTSMVTVVFINLLLPLSQAVIAIIIFRKLYLYLRALRRPELYKAKVPRLPLLIIATESVAAFWRLLYSALDPVYTTHLLQRVPAALLLTLPIPFGMAALVLMALFWCVAILTCSQGSCLCLIDRTPPQACKPRVPRPRHCVLVLAQAAEDGSIYLNRALLPRGALPGDAEGDVLQQCDQLRHQLPLCAMRCAPSSPIYMSTRSLRAASQLHNIGALSDAPTAPHPRSS